LPKNLSYLSLLKIISAMKNLFVSLVLLCVSWSAFAQNDTKAKAILDKMSAKYKSMNSFKADFKYTLVSNTDKKSDSFEGTITVKKNKYRIKIGQQEIYNNTKTVWTYMADAKEVSITNFEPDPNDPLQTPSQIFELYQKGFKYLYLGEKSIDGVKYDVVDLAPENPKQSKVKFFKIQLLIDKKDNSLKSWEIFENQNINRYSFSMKNFVPNVNVDDNFFVFDTKAYPKVEVVDLR